MAKVFARLGAIGEAMLPNRRKVSSSIIQISAEITSSHGDRASATIGDVSAHGCSVRTDSDWLRIGGFISIRLDEGQPLQAIVRWVRDGTAGIEFLRPVPPERAEWHELMDSPYNL